MNDKKYQLANLGKKLQMSRTYRGYNNQTKFAELLHFSKQNWNLWEIGKRLPSLNNLCTIANFLKIDINFYFTADTNIKNYDMTINKQQYADLQENINFVKTANVLKLQTIISKSLQKKSVFAINADFNTGVSRFFLEFKFQNSDCTYIWDYWYSKVSQLQDLINIKWLMIDNGEKLLGNEWPFIFEFYKNFNGSIIIAGKNIKNKLIQYGYENSVSEYFHLKSITIREFEDIVNANLPGINNETLNLIKFQTNQELMRLDKLLLAINEEKKKDENFKLTFKTVFEICLTKMIFL